MPRALARPSLGKAVGLQARSGETTLPDSMRSMWSHIAGLGAFVDGFYSVVDTRVRRCMSLHVQQPFPSIAERTASFSPRTFANSDASIPSP